MRRGCFTISCGLNFLEYPNSWDYQRFIGKYGKKLAWQQDGLFLFFTRLAIGGCGFYFYRFKRIALNRGYPAGANSVVITNYII